MNFLLDTNVVSELRKPAERVTPAVRSWAQQTPADRQYLSAITIGELELGVLRKERDDPFQGSRLRRWLDTDLIPRFAGRILPLDHRASRQAMLFELGRSRGIEDAYIAGIAEVNAMTIVTRNVRDFEDTGVPVLDPWLE